MKKIIIILDGLADKKNPTSLELAKTPTLNFLAKNGVTGLVYPIKGIAPDSGASQFSILTGSLKNFPGRGVLEALGINIKLKKNQIALRCNFAKIINNKIINRRTTITKSQSKKINQIDKDIKIIPTIGYRGVMIVNNASPKISNTDPAYIEYKNISKAVTPILRLKKCNGDKKTSKKINNFISKVNKILKNKTILIRGPGSIPKKQKKLKNWSLIADMPVEIGLGKLLSMKILKRKKDETKQIINCKSNIYVQIKGPDIPGHFGNKKAKIKAIEKIDKMLNQLTKIKNSIICITSDHATPPSLKRHSKDPVPILIYGNNKKDNIQKFSERACKKGSLGIIEGKDLMSKL